MKKIISTFLIIIILFTPFLASAENKKSALDNYVQYFYNRYSKHFTEYGLKYSIPDYEINEFITPQGARELISLPFYYKYQALKNNPQAIQNIKLGLFNAYQELIQRAPESQSFADAEVHFLAIRILDEFPDLISYKSKSAILDIIKNYAEAGIKAKDTENRAIVSGTHWQYIINYLFDNKIVNLDKKIKFEKLIQNKIDTSIQKSINSNYWYLENNLSNFSIHYHSLSAFMLMIYGELTETVKYLYLAQKMYQNIKKITFNNGKVPAQLGHRPTGLGAQFYLMQGLLGYYFKDKKYMDYLSYADGDRFFTDPNYPNRLVFQAENNLNDDYAFCDIAELGLIIPKLKNIYLYYKINFEKSKKEFIDNTFYIKNTGQEIIFERTKKKVTYYKSLITYY